MDKMRSLMRRINLLERQLEKERKKTEKAKRKAGALNRVRLLSAPELSRLCKVSKGRVKEWKKTFDLSATTRGKQPLFAPDQVLAWALERHCRLIKSTRVGMASLARLILRFKWRGKKVAEEYLAIHALRFPNPVEEEV